MSSTDVNGLLGRVPYVQSALAGLAAYVASFVVIAALVAATEDGDDLLGSSGNILYGAHFIDSEVEATVAGSTDTQTDNFLTEASLELPEIVYQLVPILVLIVVGIALVRFLKIREIDVAAVAGAASAIGYLVLTIVGTFVFELEQDIEFGGQPIGDATASPELGLMTVLLMGILYPVVFGGLGGVIGSKLADR